MLAIFMIISSCMLFHFEAVNILCGKGQYFSNGQCLSCPEKHYMPFANHNLVECLPCTSETIDFGSKIFYKPCNDTHDTVFKCTENRFKGNEEPLMCFKCRNCTDLNKYEIKQCTDIEDAICCESADMKLKKKKSEDEECKYSSSHSNYCCYKNDSKDITPSALIQYIPDENNAHCTDFILVNDKIIFKAAVNLSSENIDNAIFSLEYQASHNDRFIPIEEMPLRQCNFSSNVVDIVCKKKYAEDNVNIIISLKALTKLSFSKFKLLFSGLDPTNIPFLFESNSLALPHITDPDKIYPHINRKEIVEDNCILSDSNKHPIEFCCDNAPMTIKSIIKRNDKEVSIGQRCTSYEEESNTFAFFEFSCSACGNVYRTISCKSVNKNLISDQNSLFSDETADEVKIRYIAIASIVGTTTSFITLIIIIILIILRVRRRRKETQMSKETHIHANYRALRTGLTKV